MIGNTVEQNVKELIVLELAALHEGLALEVPSKDSLVAEQAIWEKNFSFVKKEQEKLIADEEEKDIKQQEEAELADKTSLENQIVTLNQELERYKKELISLGLFSFSKKKKCKENIEKAAELLEKTKADLSKLPTKFKQKKSALEKKFEKKREELIPNMFLNKLITLSPCQKFNIQNYIYENWPIVLEKEKNGCKYLELSNLSRLELTCYILVCIAVMKCATVGQIDDVMSYIMKQWDLGKLVSKSIIERHGISGRTLSEEDLIEEYLDVYTHQAISELDNLLDQFNLKGARAFIIKNS